MADDGSRDRASEHAAIRRLADELLPSLMARLEASPLGELEVSQDGWRLRLRKPPEATTRTDDGRSARVPGSGKPVLGRSAQAKGTSRSGGRSEHSGERGESSRRVVTSPAVGTFHPQAGASLGRAVRAGDVVGHVEVLGVPQEVLAPFDGALGRLLVEPGQVVEYGEALFRIESSGQAPASPPPEAARQRQGSGP